MLLVLFELFLLLTRMDKNWPQIIHKYIFDNLWKHTGISVKYKTQIGTNDHKLSKILYSNWQANERFKVMSLQSMIFVTTRPIKQACWRSLLQKFKVQSFKDPTQPPLWGEEQGWSRFKVPGSSFAHRFAQI